MDLLALLFLFITIYHVKADYRKLVWENEALSDKIAILGLLISLESISEATSTDIQDNESLLQTIHRLNQLNFKSYRSCSESSSFSNGGRIRKMICLPHYAAFLWPEYS
jgi:hypothetical protein